jgi:hypothetical protein
VERLALARRRTVWCLAGVCSVLLSQVGIVVGADNQDDPVESPERDQRGCGLGAEASDQQEREVDEREGDGRPEREGTGDTSDTVDGEGSGVSEGVADGATGAGEARDGRDLTAEGVGRVFHSYLDRGRPPHKNQRRIKREFERQMARTRLK